MERKIRILGVAPYEGMKTLMSTVAEEFPQIELTVFVGDRLQGVEIARSNFHGNFDAVISRGNTAMMLRNELALPVIDVEVSMYDLLCTMRLVGDLNESAAIVSFDSCTANAKLICDLMGYSMEIFTVEDEASMESALVTLQQKRCRSVLCDVMSNAAAKRLGLNSFLIVSGTDSIRQAFRQVISMYTEQERLRDENRFLRELLRGQIGQTIVFDDSGSVFLSTMDESAPEVMELLHGEIAESRTVQQRRITRSLGGMIYSIRSRRIESGSLSLTAFFFMSRKAAVAPAQMGIRFYSRAEAEKAYYQSVFSFAGAIGGNQEQVNRISQSGAPVMVSGEDGTGKKNMVSALYMRSPLQNAPLVSIQCSLLNDKSWNFLLEHHSSPLAEEGNTIYFAGIDALSQERQRQLLTALIEMDICRRNWVLLSCVCQADEQITAAGIKFQDELHCVSLYLPPLRQRQNEIPELVKLSLSHLNADFPRQIVGVEPEAVSMLQAFPWPHNYAQFRRVLEELAVTSTTPFITAQSVRQVLRKERHQGTLSPQEENGFAPLDLNRPLDEINRDIAMRVIEDSKGNLTTAAKRLGVSRTTLWRLRQEQIK